MKTLVQPSLICYHCGNDCPDDHIHIEEKNFCCEGCKTVYEILDANNLCNYYQGEVHAGIIPEKAQFEFLDNPQIVSQLIDFKNDNFERITFYIPTIHCSSCLYLLENLYKIQPAVKYSRVDFLRKQVTIDYYSESENQTKSDPKPKTTLRKLAELLTSLGYEPLISLNDVVKENKEPANRNLMLKIGVAGFCAANIMLFSFPEYLGLSEVSFKNLFGYLNFIFAIPVVFYSGSGYFDSVYRSLRKGVINIDVPILLGILTAFFRGVYEVFSLNGAGYFDSVSGLIFFLLIGKWFQQKTYNYLSFERDYKSYFPLAVTRLNRGKEEAIPVASLEKGDKILIRHNELIPADGMIYKGNALIDYSFVTGESQPERRKIGDLLYAGGKQMGESIEIEVLKDVSQSYLTQLWNNEAFQKNHTSHIKSFADSVGKYFTIGILILAIAVGFFWWNLYDTSRALNAFTAVLIIACPCALSLSYPFALGNGLRILGKQHFYLKNSEVFERLSKCDAIVFDKTGTLTNSGGNITQFLGKRNLCICEQIAIKSITKNSTHPISQRISSFYENLKPIELENFQEYIGLGMCGYFNGHLLKIGSAKFLDIPEVIDPKSPTVSFAHVSIDQEYVGLFEIHHSYRENIEQTLKGLGEHYESYLLSGDHDGDRSKMSQLFKAQNVHFIVSPQGKLDFIKKLQAQGKNVMMVGDGLNDAGALKQADVGIAITENSIHFTPASDAILDAKYLKKLPDFLSYSKYGMQLIKFSFGVSLIYNIIGLSFAISGNLSPVIAAILMPVSSVTMLIIASMGMIYRGNKL
jgi:P-type Cu+ transporter